MRDSKSTMKKLVLPLFVGLLVFVGLDTLVFRSGLYSRELSPLSIGGAAYYTDYFEKRRLADPGRDVLLTGDSRMSEGFSSHLANTSPAGKELHFIQAGIPGSTLRVWYYLLKDMDPKANRYRAIVLSLPSFRHVGGYDADPNNRPLDADILEPIITSRDFLDLTSTFPTYEARGQLWLRAAVAATNYRTDFQDFLLHPKTRIRGVRWRRSVASSYADDYTGHPESMAGLALDPQTQALIYPERLTSNEREAVDHRFKSPPPGSPDALDQYNAYWLKKICERYAHSGTKIVLARMPSTPLPQVTADGNAAAADFLAAIKGRPNAIVLPEGTFMNLETPDFFFDTNHLNAEGRKTFTAQMVEAIPTVLAPQTSDPNQLTAMKAQPN